MQTKVSLASLMSKLHQLTYTQRSCRKMTLMKHQRRTHSLEPVTRMPAETTSSEQSALSPVASYLPNHQRVFAHQAYYPNIATAAHDFYFHNLPMALVAVQTQPPALTQNNPVTSSLEAQHAQQQYLQLATEDWSRCTNDSQV